MLHVYTSMYGYDGPNRLDITIKGNDPIGKIFAPTWKLVQALKEGKISEERYKNLYHMLMVRSLKENSGVWREILKSQEVVFVCFCHYKKFCHRFLLARYFEKLGAKYKGETLIRKDKM